MGDFSDPEIGTSEALSDLSRIEIKEDEAESFAFDLDSGTPLHEKLLTLAEEISKDLDLSSSPSPKRLSPESCKEELQSPRRPEVEACSELSNVSSVVEVSGDGCAKKLGFEGKSVGAESLLSEGVSLESREASYAEDSSQGFFLQAAFELLEKSARFEAQILEDIGKTYPELPASNEVIMSGQLRLRKSKESQFGHWKTRYVVISAGKLTYVCHPDAETSAANQITKMFIAKGEAKKKLIKGFELPLGTYCSVVEKRKDKSGKFLFRIVTPKVPGVCDWIDSALWSANSREERQQWMTAIQIAARPELLSHALAKGIDPLQERCEMIWKGIHKAPSEEQYFAFLSETLGAPWIADCLNPSVDDDDDAMAVRSGGVLHVPVEWVQSKLQRRRGAGDNDILQVFRDLQRDRISINGEVFLGASYQRGNVSGGDFAGPAICSIISALAQVVQQHTADGTYMTSAQALAFSREVLLACNRTQSGGNTYEAVNLLCGNKDYVVIIPESNQASPLKITICKESSGRTEGREPEANEMQDERNKSGKVARAMSSRRGSKSDSDFEAFPTRSIFLGTNRSNRSSSSPPSPLPPRTIKVDTPVSVETDSTPGMHRRTLSEPFDPILEKLPGKNGRSGSAAHELVSGGPNVRVQVDMHYKIMRLNAVDDREAVVAKATTIFRRSFACAGQRAVALGQGTVELTLFAP